MIALGILGSTRGSSLEPVIQAIDDKRLAAEIKIVLSDRKEAGILTRAITHHLPALWMECAHQTRDAHDKHLSTILHQHHVELVVLIGYMRILGKPFVTEWHHRILNVHPSLLPAFAGQMDRALHQAVLDSGVTETGCTIHWVTEAVDQGPIVVQKRCPVLENDTVETLKTRVQRLEGMALIEAIAQFKVES